jgi:ABC-type uncharacterized transport system substrate-binding protein
MICRRGFLNALAGLSSLAVPTHWPTTGTARNTRLPVVALFRSTPAAPFGNLVAALHRGLGDEGLTDGINVSVLLRWADNNRARLPEIADELVRRRVAVIVGNSLAVEAAKTATPAIPIVFVTSDDPIKRGLVKTFARPGSNLTGLTFFGSQLGAKRLQFLSELAPGQSIALIMDPNFPASKFEREDIQRAANLSGLHIVIGEATGPADVEAAIERARSGGAGALLFGASPNFTSNRKTIVALAKRYHLPAIYDVPAYVKAGGLMSYSASFVDAYRQAGRYAGRIVKGAKPADLPVLRPTKFDLAVNMKAAKELGLAFPQSILIQANDVTE